LSFDIAGDARLLWTKICFREVNFSALYRKIARQSGFRPFFRHVSVLAEAFHFYPDTSMKGGMRATIERSTAFPENLRGRFFAKGFNVDISGPEDVYLRARERQKGP